MSPPAAMDLALLPDDQPLGCGVCHESIAAGGGGVSLGRPCFQAPAVNVCRRCLQSALSLLDLADARAGRNGYVAPVNRGGRA